MNHDRLRLDLADLADEVTPVDLRDRALRTSRRLGIQRAVATSAAVVALVAAATGTAFAVIPRADGPTPLPADTPSVTVPPSPPVDPSPAPSVESTVLGGTRYYLGLTGNQATVHAVRGDSDEVLTRFPLPDEDLCVRNTVTISPDGRWMAYVQANPAGGNSGTLLASTPGKPGSMALLEDVNCLGPRALVWKGGDLLMAHRKTGQSVLYDVAANKRVAGDPGQETDRCWSADGTWLAAVSDGKPYVTDGTQSRQYSYTPPPSREAQWDGWGVRSVSMDGRYVAVGWNGTDPSRQDDSFGVVDTTTSRLVELPGDGEIRSILFTIDNKVLVKRATGISVLDSSFRPLGTVPESTALKNLKLFAYVP